MLGAPGHHEGPDPERTTTTTTADDDQDPSPAVALPHASPPTLRRRRHHHRSAPGQIVARTLWCPGPRSRKTQTCYILARPDERTTHGIRRLRPAVRAPATSATSTRWRSTSASCATSRSAWPPTAPASSTCGAPSTTSSTSTATCPGPRCTCPTWPPSTERVHVGSAIFNITPKVNNPARVAETVALLDHITEGRFEFGTGRGSSTTEVFGFDIDDLDETTRCGTRRSARSRRCGRTASTPTRAPTSACPPARCSPSPTATAPAPCGSRPAALRPSPRPVEMGLGAFCFTHGTPSKIAPLIAPYKDAVGHAEPVGDYVNDNIMVVTNMVCMEDREAGLRDGRQHRHELLHEPADALARQHPEARRLPGVARPHPRAHDRAAQEGVRDRHGRGRRSRRLRQGRAALGGHRRRPAVLQPDHQQHGPGATIIARRWSCSAKRSSRSSTPTRCTAPRACREAASAPTAPDWARPARTEQSDRAGGDAADRPSTSPTSGRRSSDLGSPTRTAVGVRRPCGGPTPSSTIGPTAWPTGSSSRASSRASTSGST